MKRFTLLLVLCSGLTVNASFKVQGSQEMRELFPGVPIERELAGGELHTYRLTLGAGQYVQVIAETGELEATVTLFGPDGQKLAESFSSNGNKGPENIIFWAEERGNFRLDVRTVNKEAVPGHYEIKISELRVATTEDRSRVSARRLFDEAQHLRVQPTSESLRQAVAKYKEALPLWRTASDLRMEATTLNNIGLVYSYLSEQQNALDYYHQSLPLWRAVGRREGEAATLFNIAYIWRELGEGQQALDSYRQALTLYQETGNRSGEAAALMLTGNVYSSLGEEQQALGLYEQAFSLFAEKGDRGFALTNIGTAYLRLGEPVKALEYLNQGLIIHRQMNDHHIEAVALSNLGEVYRLLGDQPKAVEYQNQALSLTRTLGDVAGEAAALHYLARSSYASGEYQKALEFYGQALMLRHLVGDLPGEAETLYSIALVERDLGNLIEARSRIEAALSLVESLRTKVAGQELRASYFAAKRSYYELYVDLLVKLHSDQPAAGHDGAALQVSERARARSLLETLNETRGGIRNEVDSTLLKRERSLQQQLNAREAARVRLLSDRPDEKQLAGVERDLRLLLTEYEDVRARIRTSSPRYAALTQPRPLSLNEIQLQLDDDSLLLEYMLGDQRSYLWAVTRHTLTSFELPKRTEIEASSRRVYELLSARNLRVTGETPQQKQSRIAQADASYPQAALQLSRMVLGPVVTQLGGKRLLIVGDGALQYIPFGALPVPADNGRPTDKYQALVRRHEVVNLPSASVIAEMRRDLVGRTPAPKTVVVVADPVFETQDPRVKSGKITESGNSNALWAAQIPMTEIQRSAHEAGVQRFRRLRFTRQEAETITAFAPEAEKFSALDFAASREMLTRTDLSQYRIIHFATHGLLNSRHPELSGLVFSLVDEQGRPQDGFFRLHEIYNLKLNAELVVLSGCQTALGKEIKGEGLIGLTRGFMYAGAARVMSSLWSVDDRATAELMKRFYGAMLSQGMRPAAALRTAQSEMAKSRPPFYWAAFTMQGEWK